MFANKLSKLPEMFMSKEDQKSIYKEIFPYGYYNKDRYLDNCGDIDEACKYIKETKQDFM